MADAVFLGSRLLEAAVREVVRRRPHEPVPQRGRPSPRGTRRPEGADLHLDRDRRDAHVHVPRARRRGQPVRGGPEGAGRGPRRPRADLHADDRRGSVRDARVRADRRDPLRRLRRLRRGEPRDPDRRREAKGDGHLRLRDARRQAGPLQASRRRIDPARRESAAPRDHRQPRTRQGHEAGRRTRSRLRRAACAAHECERAVRMARIVRAVVHPVHVRNDRQAEGRPARYRRLRGRPCVVDAAHLLRRAGRVDVHHERHRMGGRPLATSSMGR